MSRSRLSRTLITATFASLALAVPAHAFTATDLGRCVEPGNPIRVESLTVSNPVSVGADGYGRGTIGLTMRTKSIAYQGGPIQIRIDAVDPLTNRTTASATHFVGDGGCKRYVFKMDELQLKLKRTRLYSIRVDAYYTDPVGQPAVQLPAAITDFFLPSQVIWVN